jgi:hypothetical protein
MYTHVSKCKNDNVKTIPGIRREGMKKSSGGVLKKNPMKIASDLTNCWSISSLSRPKLFPVELYEYWQ